MNVGYKGLNIEYYGDNPQIEDPPWKKRDRVHCWRNHIPSEVQEKWDKLTYGEKFMLFYLAEQAAQAEDWD